MHEQSVKGPFLIQPDHGEVSNITCDEDLWREAWKFLHWKYRCNDNVTNYWRVLHSRVRFSYLNNATASADDVNQPSSTSGISLCPLCKLVRDSTKHGFCECPYIQNVWLQAVGLLVMTLPSGPFRTLMSARTRPFVYAEILFPFATFPEAVSYAEKSRLYVWHAAVMDTISQLRDTGITLAQSLSQPVEFRFGNFRSKCLLSYKKILTELYLRLYTKQQAGNDDTSFQRDLDQFFSTFVAGGVYVTRVVSSYSFLSAEDALRHTMWDLSHLPSSTLLLSEFNTFLAANPIAPPPNAPTRTRTWQMYGKQAQKFQGVQLLSPNGYQVQSRKSGKSRYFYLFSLRFSVPVAIMGSDVSNDDPLDVTIHATDEDEITVLYDGRTATLPKGTWSDKEKFVKQYRTYVQDVREASCLA